MKFVEIVPMPTFDAHAAEPEEAASAVELPEAVVSELQMFMSMISSM